MDLDDATPSPHYRPPFPRRPRLAPCRVGCPGPCNYVRSPPGHVLEGVCVLPALPEKPEPLAGRSP